MEVDVQYNKTDIISQIKKHIINNLDYNDLLTRLQNHTKDSTNSMDIIVYVFTLLLKNDLLKLNLIKSYLKV